MDQKRDTWLSSYARWAPHSILIFVLNYKKRKKKKKNVKLKERAHSILWPEKIP